MHVLNKPKRRAAVLLAIGLIVGLGAWHASQRVGTGPASGEGLENPPVEMSGRGGPFRVATLNIAGGKGADGRPDLDRTAKVLGGLDLIALQEVHGDTLGQANNQADALAGSMKNFGWLYAPTETRWYSQQFGNAVISNMGVRRWQRIPLPREYDKSYRNVVSMTVEHQGQKINVLVTHVTQRDPRDREMQLRAVIELFLSLEEPVILMGDLNSQPDSSMIRELLARPGVEDPIGQLAEPPPKNRVDWIFVRGLKCLAAGVRDEGVSDHPLYWAEVELLSEKENNSKHDDFTP